MSCVFLSRMYPFCNGHVENNESASVDDVFVGHVCLLCILFESGMLRCTNVNQFHFPQYA